MSGHPELLALTSGAVASSCCSLYSLAQTGIHNVIDQTNNPLKYNSHSHIFALAVVIMPPPLKVASMIMDLSLLLGFKQYLGADSWVPSSQILALLGALLYTSTCIEWVSLLNQASARINAYLQLAFAGRSTKGPVRTLFLSLLGLLLVLYHCNKMRRYVGLQQIISHLLWLVYPSGIYHQQKHSLLFLPAAAAPWWLHALPEKGRCISDHIYKWPWTLGCSLRRQNCWFWGCQCKVLLQDHWNSQMKVVCSWGRTFCVLYDHGMTSLGAKSTHRTQKWSKHWIVSNWGLPDDQTKWGCQEGQPLPSMTI